MAGEGLLIREEVRRMSRTEVVGAALGRERGMFGRASRGLQRASCVVELIVHVLSLL